MNNTKKREKLHKISIILFLGIFGIGAYLSNTISSETKTASFNIIASDAEVKLRLKLAPGVNYENILINNGKYRHSTHVMEADLENPDCSIALLLGENRAGGRETLHDMISFYDSTNLWEVVGAVNGSFWRKYNSFPIGPTIKDGEIIELNTYKKWSSCLFDELNHPYFGYFPITGIIDLNIGNKIKIESVNRRSDSTGVVLYNRFGGDTIPYIHYEQFDAEIDEAVMNALEDREFSDSTEGEFDTEKFRAELVRSKRAAAKEFSLNKAVLIYHDEPAINKEIMCKVIYLKSGAVNVPRNGCVISFGEDIPISMYPEPSDLVSIKFNTKKYKDVIFKHGVSAVPQLIRDGIANPGASEEGATSRRFINNKLPRTAIGTNKDQTKLYLAVVQRGNRSEGINGASLDDMAMIMKKIGCYNAMNLDGGGSSIMVINNENVTRPDRPDASRKLAIGVAIIKSTSKEFIDILDKD